MSRGDLQARFAPYLRFDDVRRHKIAFPARRSLIALAAVVGALAFIQVADRRDWIPWPDYLSAPARSFDRFEIDGKAPWCFLDNPLGSSVNCHYLSKDHCNQWSYPFMTHDDPALRGLCVPSPLEGGSSLA